MCVRTLISTKVTSDAVTAPPTSKFTKAKEKYMKLYDELVHKEMKIVSDKISKTQEIYPSEITPDILGKGTTMYGQIVEGISRFLDTWKDSKMSKILFETAQPAHAIMMAAVLCVISALVPTSDRINSEGHLRSRAMSFIYLMSFAVHFGSQIWMTFVSGLSLYFELPRHTFGEVQRVLFPRYFTINACLSLTTLLIYLEHHPMSTWNTEITTQIIGMTVTFFLELLIRLYLTPPLLALMMQKIMIERAAGVGNEVGTYNPGVLKHCPHYLKIHAAFRKVHVTIAMGNIITMACTVLHLYYIASKLCIL